MTAQEAWIWEYLPSENAIEIRLNSLVYTSVIDSLLFDLISIDVASDSLIEDNVCIAHRNNCKTYYHNESLINFNIFWSIRLAPFFKLRFELIF